MRCPGCSFVCSDLRDICPKCFLDLRPTKSSLKIKITAPKASYDDLLAQLRGSEVAQPKTAAAPQSGAAKPSQSAISSLTRKFSALFTPKVESGKELRQVAGSRSPANAERSSTPLTQPESAVTPRSAQSASSAGKLTEVEGALQDLATILDSEVERRSPADALPLEEISELHTESSPHSPEPEELTLNIGSIERYEAEAVEDALESPEPAAEGEAAEVAPPPHVASLATESQATDSQEISPIDPPHMAVQESGQPGDAPPEPIIELTTEMAEPAEQEAGERGPQVIDFSEEDSDLERMLDDIIGEASIEVEAVDIPRPKKEEPGSFEFDLELLESLDSEGSGEDSGSTAQDELPPIEIEFADADESGVAQDDAADMPTAERQDTETTLVRESELPRLPAEYGLNQDTAERVLPAEKDLRSQAPQESAVIDLVEIIEEAPPTAESAAPNQSSWDSVPEHAPHDTEAAGLEAALPSIEVDTGGEIEELPVDTNAPLHDLVDTPSVSDLAMEADEPDRESQMHFADSSAVSIVDTRGSLVDEAEPRESPLPQRIKRHQTSKSQTPAGAAGSANNGVSLEELLARLGVGDASTETQTPPVQLEQSAEPRVPERAQRNLSEVEYFESLAANPPWSGERRDLLEFSMQQFLSRQSDERVVLYFELAKEFLKNPYARRAETVTVQTQPKRLKSATLHQELRKAEQAYDRRERQRSYGGPEPSEITLPPPASALTRLGAASLDIIGICGLSAVVAAIVMTGRTIAAIKSLSAGEPVSPDFVISFATVAISAFLVLMIAYPAAAAIGYGKTWGMERRKLKLVTVNNEVPGLQQCWLWASLIPLSLLLGAPFLILFGKTTLHEGLSDIRTRRV